MGLTTNVGEIKYWNMASLSWTLLYKTFLNIFFNDSYCSHNSFILVIKAKFWLLYTFVHGLVINITVNIYGKKNNPIKILAVLQINHLAASVKPEETKKQKKKKIHICYGQNFIS